MSYLGVYRALYDLEPRAGADPGGEAELAVRAGDLLYIVAKDTDANWWKARKKAANEDEEEPEGIVPRNYIEEAQPIGTARALYEYTRQTEEELSFPDGAILDVYDASEQDWTLVGLDGDFGFVPSNYIDFTPGTPNSVPPSHASDPSTDISQRLSSDASESTTVEHTAVEKAVGTHGGQWPPVPVATFIEPSGAAGSQACQAELQSPEGTQSYSGSSDRLRSEVSFGSSRDYRPTELPLPIDTQRHNGRPESDRLEAHDEDRLAFVNDASVRNSGDSSNRDKRRDSTIQASPAADHLRISGNFHLYNINEMVSVLGKKKKMPSTLGINIATKVISIAPERPSDGRSQEWTAEKMTHHSREGKHVFLELVRPSRSIDFHAGAKDTAEEIVGALDELASIIRAEGLCDSILSADKQRKGVVLYDFVAQGDDEVTVGVGDEVLILNDTQSEEWWNVRRLKSGKEGVVPSSYIQPKGLLAPTSPSVKSTVEQNRLAEKRLVSEVVRANSGSGAPNSSSSPTSAPSSQSRGHHSHKASRTKPDPSRLRSWTDRSQSFTVEAQFLGVKDGKVNLHKANGVKIAVPLAKMSIQDLEYIERATGIPTASTHSGGASASGGSQPTSTQPKPQPPTEKLGASVDQPRKPDYDWFQFFLACEVAVGLCERYAQSFVRDSMDESVLPDVDATVLRNLGLREGDIIKVMRVLDDKFGRTAKRGTAETSTSGASDGGSGGLFSGPGGALRNNTKKGRPPPAMQTSSVVDASAFATSNPADISKSATGTQNSSTAPDAPLSSNSGSRSGFDDNAWDVKPPKRVQSSPPAPQPQPQPNPNQPPSQAQEPPAASASALTSKDNHVSPQLTGSLQELSLLTEPLQPSRQETSTPITSSSATARQSTIGGDLSAGASPAFFAGLGPALQASATGQPQQQATIPVGIIRQRPVAPPASTLSNPLVPPPPQRPLSAPQSAQPSAFTPPPLTAQMTGYQAPIGHGGPTLHDLNQMRLQQQQQLQQLQLQQQQQQYTQQIAGFGVKGPGAPAMFPQAAYQTPMMTGYGQPILTQPTGMGIGFADVYAQPQVPAMTEPINSYLPPALEPQRTGLPVLLPSMTGLSPPVPNSGLMPLQPQKTGPPPDLRFGITPEAKKLVPQPTGRRANLAQATPENPFGF